MKARLDLLLIGAIALCYTAGQFIAADRFAMTAGALLLILVVRFLGGTLIWLIHGK